MTFEVVPVRGEHNVVYMDDHEVVFRTADEDLAERVVTVLHLARYMGRLTALRGWTDNPGDAGVRFTLLHRHNTDGVVSVAAYMPGADTRPNHLFTTTHHATAARVLAACRRVYTRTIMNHHSEAQTLGQDRGGHRPPAG
jgi:hypothetical protein